MISSRFLRSAAMFVAFLALFVGLSVAFGALVAGPVLLVGIGLIGLTAGRRTLSGGSMRGLQGMLCLGVLFGLMTLVKDWKGGPVWLGWIAGVMGTLLFGVGLVLASSAGNDDSTADARDDSPRA
ncbi:MAG TPA: hypothetical protein VGO40_13550 [Longimicrobium sp.]|jgi:hypothetical protein|nr:hypothetical protein [Longimicrobium sp.]